MSDSMCKKSGTRTTRSMRDVDLMDMLKSNGARSNVKINESNWEFPNAKN